MGDKGDKSAARPPEGCPAEAGGIFGPESALGFEHPSCTNARRPSQKAKSEPLFILRSTSVRIWHKAVFKVGPVAGPKPNAIGSSKNATDPVGIPLFEAPQAPGDKPNPSEEG